MFVPRARAFFAGRDLGSDEWAQLMPSVVKRLIELEKLPRPISRGSDLRFGGHASLSIAPASGRWYDHEGESGGGTLALVEWAVGGSRADALDWLVREGFIREQRGLHPRGVSQTASTGRVASARTPQSKPAGESPDPRIEFVRRVWRAAERPEGTPGHAWAASRHAFPPVSVAPEFPGDVRWLPGERAPEPCEEAKWCGLPRGAAGALAFAYRRDGGEGQAVSLVAVTAEGKRVPWFASRTAKIRALGPRAEALCVLRRAGAADPVYVLEGEVTALAALHAPWVGHGWVVAVGGTSGLRRLAADRLPGKGPIVLYADGEAAGRLAAREARAAALRMGRAARVVESAQGMDAADELAEWIEERAAIREGGGEPRERALAEAWRDLARRRLRGGGK